MVISWVCCVTDGDFLGLLCFVLCDSVELTGVCVCVCVCGGGIMSW